MKDEKITYIELGSEEYPIPIGAEYDKDGNVVRIKWLSSEEEALYIPTMRVGETQEQLYGRFIRDVVSDPVLLRSMSELIRRTDSSFSDKSEKSSALTMVGDPGCGKTYLASRIAELLHPRGAFKVDCHNLPEPERLYQKTIIGQNDDKLQTVVAYVDRYSVKGGKGHENAMEICQKIEKEFGKDYVADLSYDSATFFPDQIKRDFTPQYIDQVMSEIIKEYEIPYEKEANSMGLSYENGPLLQALVDPSSPDFGRPIILDEANRIPEVDAWLTISAFFSDPNVQKLTLRGEDDREFTIRREDLPENFLLISTANPATEEMGSSAQTMTRPMVSRSGSNIDIITSGRAEQSDYISRTLKHFTGVPAYMVYMRDQGFYEKNMETLAEELMYLRIVGLEGVDNPNMWAAKLLANPYLRDEKMPEALKLIPKDELFNIKHIDRTIKVAQNYGALLYEGQELVEQLIKDEDIAETYKNYLKENAVIDLRYVFKLFQSSQTMGEVKEPETKQYKQIGSRTKTQEEIRLRQQQRVMDRKDGRKFLRGDMLDKTAVSKVINILRPDNYNDFFANLDTEEIQATAQKVKTACEKILEIAKKCKFESAGYVGPDSVAKQYNARTEDFEENAEEKDIAKILIESINETIGTNLKPNDISGKEALALLERLLNEDSEENTVIVPSHNPKDYEKANFKPFQGTKIQSSDEDVIDPKELATVDQFMDSMIIDKAREHNLKKLMAQAKANAQKDIIYPEDMETSEVKTLVDIISGENPDIFVSMVLLQDNGDKTKDPEARFAILLYNKKEDKVGIVSSFDVSESDHKKLKEKSIVVLNAEKQNIGASFMDFVRGDNKEIKDQDIFASVYLIMNPDFVSMINEDEDIVSIWNSIGSSNFNGDMYNRSQVCRIEKPKDKAGLLNRIQSSLGM